MATPGTFEPALFRFLRGLAEDNSKEWFQAHKADYEAIVKGPALEFIAALAPRMAQISKSIEVIPKAVGGSLQRMNRDTRFSKDKRPYKTSVGFMFGHLKAPDLMFGYHLTLARKDDGGCKAYVGLWDPDAAALEKVRTRILVKPDEWSKAVGGTFGKTHTFEGESLKRPPKVGDCAVDPNHPLVEALKRKSFAASAHLEEKAITSPGFLDQYVASIEAGVPLMNFLAKALGLPF